jgi:hypothetical protein
MSETLTLLAIGLFLIASLVYLLRRREAEADDESWLWEGNSARPSAQLADLQKEQLNRIFGREDWDFIRRSTSREVQRLFLKERKGIALSWLSQLRRQARAGMHLHLASVRASEGLEPLAELRLAIDYCAFLSKCEVIAAILLLGGPTALRAMAGQAECLSNNLRGMLEAALKPQAFSQKSRIR